MVTIQLQPIRRQKIISLKMDNNPSEILIKPAVVESVVNGSIGEELGFEAGDKILSINGIKPRDLIDYRFLIAEEDLHIEAQDIYGKLHEFDIEKDLDQELGLIFTEALFDSLKQCNNHCPFCFIDQQPLGKRKSLYFKDDDFRLSFLYGSYLTLTNLTNSDWIRIDQQRLSPLFVSVHATEPALRAKLLKNSKAGLLMEQLKWFARKKLQIHAQIVVCPGQNDGQSLNQTLLDLAKFAEGDWPVVLSAAVVPVGLTRFRPKGDGLIAVNKVCAEKVIKQVEILQKEFKSKLGSRFAWLADEWYLIAEKPLPKRNTYEDLPQQENGVGSIREFLESMDRATSNLPEALTTPHECSWVVGQLVEKALIPSCKRLNKIKGLKLHLHGLPSPYWGQEKVVTGLLTGQDLIDGLINSDLGNQLLIPSVMLKKDTPIFLDDMTLDDLKTALGVQICIVDGADQIVAAALGNFASIL